MRSHGHSDNATYNALRLLDDVCPEAGLGFLFEADRRREELIAALKADPSRIDELLPTKRRSK